MNDRNTLFRLRLDNRPRGLSHAGFSMIELLIVIGILAILFTFMYKGFERLNRYYTAENVKANTQQSARIGIEMMVQDIRLAGLNPLGTAGAGIVAASPTSFQFTADANFDGDLDDPFENITYDLNGTDLRQRNSNLLLSPNFEVLLSNVTTLAFTYLDDTGIPTANLADIRTVGITLTVNRPAGRDGTVSRTYTTQVRCRNL
ncbi:MAG TPA: prepilin-type N-terminal cleavage/methylation domain-containing protein [Desulfobacterales bacterium]|jgi:type IV pilus assembly protein PilW|nr:prepilin-type N-terminal cleavage/methylation domain-containing protein [Desulfobacterales bacterium]